MRYGVREICDVVLKAKSAQQIGNKVFYKDEPVLYFDSLKTSTLEGAATTVYATGGRGNPRLVAWEGERTVTFTMEDALISPESFMILTGAGLIEAGTGKKSLKIHTTERTDKVKVVAGTPGTPAVPDTYEEVNTITNQTTLDAAIEEFGTIYSDNAGETAVTIYDSDIEHFYKKIAGTPAVPGTDPAVEVYVKEKPFNRPEGSTENYIYVMRVDGDEILTEPYCVGVTAEEEPVTDEGDYKGLYKITIPYEVIENDRHNDLAGTDPYAFKTGDIVLVDFYVEKESLAQQIEITPDKFGGNYYLEASTLFRNTQGVDLPAEFIIPNCKVQSNFTFSMSATGDPSTFTFTMDAFPDYTRFDKTKKVLAAIQIIQNDYIGDIVRDQTRTKAEYPFDDEALDEHYDGKVSG